MAKILVVDDSHTTKEFIKRLLVSDGHEIVGEADNGADAVEKFKELSPDITTLDINMPIMNGMDALNEIIKIDPKARVLMISSTGYSGNIPKSLVQGACEFIEKPFENEEFQKVISNIVASMEKKKRAGD